MAAGVAVYDPTNPEIFLGIAKTPRAVQIELLALSTPKQNAIYDDITSGTPAKWDTFEAEIDMTVFAASIPATSPGPTADEKMGLVAAYLYRHPFYLQAPAFDNTINIVPYIPPPPVLQSATIAANGTTLTLVFDKAATAVTTWGTNVTLTGAQSATATYVSGNGTTTVVFSLSPTIFKDGILTLSIAAGAYTGSGSNPNNALGSGTTNSSTQLSGSGTCGSPYLIGLGTTPSYSGSTEPVFKFTPATSGTYFFKLTKTGAGSGDMPIDTGSCSGSPHIGTLSVSSGSSCLSASLTGGVGYYCQHQHGGSSNQWTLQIGTGTCP